MKTDESVQFFSTLWSFFVVYGIWVLLLAVLIGGFLLFFFLGKRTKENKSTIEER